ncbi:MAG: pyruvate dehydrogenase (acetyl-transferring) E1 component subunit alpha [Bacteroidetes bacterium]|nr:pyruvate dehydrogenase (acetyl-transferring) E1 component subunit alpha [Bacteroidota bacterium]
MATTTQAKRQKKMDSPEKSVSKKVGKGERNVSVLEHDQSVYRRWFRDMYLMRKFEERCGQLYIQQKFGGFCHLYIGQEAILAGISEAIRPTDRMVTAYRDHAHPLALGTDPKFVMAELYGRTTGTSKGKGGSMHMFDKERNLFGGHGIVGGQIGLGAGIAFADKYRKEDHVTLCFFGDGAARQGILHETFNMAMMWKLPVIFIVENNKYAMGTSVERTSNVTDLVMLGASYRMPAESVDGMSPELVCAAVKRAADRGRAGEGPTLLDIQTYRYKGHSMSDPQKYRTKDELHDYQEKDPILHVRNTLLKQGWNSEDELKQVEKEVKAQVEEAIVFAEESPYPEAHELYEDVYMTKDYPFVKD